MRDSFSLAVQIAICFLLAGCHAPAQLVTPGKPNLEICGSVEDMAPFLCNTTTVVDDYECAICAQRSCILAPSLIWCVGDHGCDDVMCRPRLRKASQRVSR